MLFKDPQVKFWFLTFPGSFGDFVSQNVYYFRLCFQKKGIFLAQKKDLHVLSEE